MTRCRAGEHFAPTALAATYYQQRSGAGLIITEGTSPSPNGQGYARIPGLWNEAQVAGWAHVTTAVHEKGAKIFAQLMHTGACPIRSTCPRGAVVLAPSAVRLEGQMWTDQEQAQDYPTPRAMTEVEIRTALEEHVTAARNAIKAGFDGVELHGANGYLTEQFLNPHTNRRSDEYGGSVAARTRFALEVTRAWPRPSARNVSVFGLSPYGVASGMSPYPEVDATYLLLAQEFSKLGIAYLHVVDHSALGAPPCPASIKQTIRQQFKGAYIAAGGFDRASAESVLESKAADLVAFGRPFLANPDLVARLEHGWELATRGHVEGVHARPGRLHRLPRRTALDFGSGPALAGGQALGRRSGRCGIAACCRMSRRSLLPHPDRLRALC